MYLCELNHVQVATISKHERHSTPHLVCRNVDALIGMNRKRTGGERRNDARDDADSINCGNAGKSSER